RRGAGYGHAVPLPRLRPGPPGARGVSPFFTMAPGPNSLSIHAGAVVFFPVVRHSPTQEHTMSEQKHVRLELTEEQKAQVKAATGKDARAIELNAEELESRIAPLQIKHPK